MGAMQNNTSLSLAISYIKRQKQNYRMQRDRPVLLNILMQNKKETGYFSLN